MTNWATALRSELRSKAERWAKKTGLPFYQSRGRSPTILFVMTPDGSRHGNFCDAAWQAINADLHWRKRLEKAHSQRKALPEEHRAQARELDSSNSSDALLMNCFCPPSAADRIAAALGIPAQPSRPQFGYSPRIALVGGAGDTTEVDMRLGATIIEAKLTEKNFTSRPRDHVFRYRDLKTCFDVELLPGAPDPLSGYQLVRNVLAAAMDGAHLVVLLDQRRPDLLDEWRRVHSAIADPHLRDRCGIRFWQEVASACEADHREFLQEKYGL